MSRVLEGEAREVAGVPGGFANAAAGIDLRVCLADNESCGVFAAPGDLVVTGPTRTNVNDFRAIPVESVCNPAEGER